MNKPAQPADITPWIAPPTAEAAPVPGYDAWLAADIAAGLAEVEAGTITPIADVRKEFGDEQGGMAGV
jgi:predicted transcriptional regulator